MSDFSKRIADLSPEKLALLAALRKTVKPEASTQSPIPKRKDSGYAPLSFAQRRLWFLDQLEPGAAVYNIARATHLRGKLDVSLLERAIKEIVRRHEVLRTTFDKVNGLPIQIIGDGSSIVLRFENLLLFAEQSRMTEALRLANAEAREGFDLSKGPLLRTKLLKLGDEEHVLLVTMHHVISDAWSMGIFMAELSKLYSSFAAGLNSPLVLPAIQYADFAQWQRDWLEQGELLKQLSYWKSQLAGAPHALELLTDRPRPLLKSYRGSREFLRFGKALTSSFKDFTRRQGATFFMGLLAAFNTLLYRYSGEEDLVIGTPIANRNRFETEELIGFFVNTLVIRTNLYGNPSFTELLARQMDVALGAYANQDVPFEKLVEELAPQRDLSRTPLFQIMFALQNEPKQQTHMHALSITPLGVDSGTAKFDLILFLAETEQGLRGSLEYNSDLFEPATIQRMIAHYERLLESIVKGPHKKIRDLDMLGEQETTELLENWNQTRRDYASPALIHELFERQAEKTPRSVAVVCDDLSVTYDELNRRANQLAHYLIKRGAAPETLIGICLERSIDMVVAMLGVLKAGAAYVPLDPAYPAQRLDFMLKDAQVKELITQAGQLAHLPELKANVIRIDEDWNSIADENDDNPKSKTIAGNLAYVIYTSGSTGTPKGVAIQHSSVCEFLNWTADVFSDEELSGVLFSTSICFDLSVFELFAPLIRGGAVYVVENALHLPSLKRANNVTLINTVPSAMTELLRLGGVPESVITVNLAGEPLTDRLVKKIYELESVQRVYNLYGPSEDTTYSTFALISRDTAQGPSIGRPTANTRIYLLDDSLKPAPKFMRGGMYIGGAGLARGYLHRPDMTAERFVPDPYSKHPGGRLYKTGDLARYLRDGNIDFLGRVDHQVKIRGYRIELGEVEAILSGHRGVRETVVVVREDLPGEKRIVAYVVVEQGTTTTSQLRSYLKEKLPGHMVPATIMMLDALPLTPNGKINRNALPAPDGSRPRLESDYLAPRTDVESSIARLWQQFLRIEKVGIEDNFFDLGGHSLLLVQIHAELQKLLNRDISIIELFRYPTIGSLSKYIGLNNVEEADFEQLHRRAAMQRGAMNRQKRQLRKMAT